MAIVIPENHELTVKLPRDLPPGKAEIVILSTEKRAPQRGFSVDELLAARLNPPLGVGRVSLDDMERAIE